MIDAAGQYLNATIQPNGANRYVVRYQYFLPGYSTDNCYRTDNSRVYNSSSIAEQNINSSDYVNFTMFYYDTTKSYCYDIGVGTMSVCMSLLAVVVGIFGVTSVLSTFATCDEFVNCPTHE